MNNYYEYVIPVTIGKTNATQNVYFSEYFALQGLVRELWMKDCVRNAMNFFSEGFLISTKSAHCDYKIPFFVFDTISCRMHIESLKRVSAKLVFEFINQKSKKVCATGWQIVVFKNFSRKTCRIPEDFLEAASQILWESGLIYPES